MTVTCTGRHSLDEAIRTEEASSDNIVRCELILTSVEQPGLNSIGSTLQAI